MEMVLRLRKNGMSEIGWERGSKGCLLLVLSCILYCGVGMDSADYRAKAEDTVVYSQEIKQNGSMCDGYTELICKNAKKTFTLYAGSRKMRRRTRWQNSESIQESQSGCSVWR